MSTLANPNANAAPWYAGLRMSAEDYLRLDDDGFRYELIDGVVVMSPSPTPKHQHVLAEILFQIKAFLRQRPVGNVFPETDIKLDEGLVYRPEIVFLRAENVRDNWRRIRIAPDVVVEIISPESCRYDSETKKPDYERFGVREYWLIDPDRETLTFFRLRDGRYVEVKPEGGVLRSEAIAGFELDVALVRKSFLPEQ